MDLIQSHKIEKSSTLSFEYHYYIKRMFQFLVLFSLLSLLFSYTLGFSFTFSYNFSLLNISLATFCHALERKYMFLICNGILAFLAKSLSFASPPSPGSDAYPELPESKETMIEENEITAEFALLENVAEDEEREEEHGGKEESRPGEEGIEGRIGVLLEESDEDSEGGEDEEIVESGNLIGSSSPAEAANEVNMNIEELNKKFEEFIRKMKEEIRIEAQRQLIAV